MLRRNTLATESSSTGLRLSASDTKATWSPSPEIDGDEDGPVPGAPSTPSPRLASSVLLADRLRTYTFETGPAPAARLVATEVKATKPPPSEMTGSVESPLAGSLSVPV